MMIIALIALIALSAFFSSAETAMMALNRYRLRHLVKKGDVRAKRVQALLDRPDRLLGVILVGNTFANILAASLMTVVCVHYFGNLGVLISTVFLTLFILIFAEITPKTLAALYPDRIAFPVSGPLLWLLKITYPLIWLLNTIANNLLKLFRVQLNQLRAESLSSEELRTVVKESKSKMSSSYQTMLLRILDFDNVSVEDVMVPRNDIEGIDLTEDWSQVCEQIKKSQHTFLPVYEENIGKVIGVLRLKDLFCYSEATLTRDRLLSLTSAPTFIPEGTSLRQQLINFRKHGDHVGLIVDEYGKIQGLVNLRHVVEEIIGDFPEEAEDIAALIHRKENGSYLVDGQISLRDLNRHMKWDFPLDGPKTLSGLIVERLEDIPDFNVCLQVGQYRVEVVSVKENTIEQVLVSSIKKTENK